MKNVKKISIVGAGTAGLITALILKKSFGSNIDIDIIKSDNIGIVGVGEGSTEHWLSFMKHIGITSSQLIKEADATFKAGIYFKDWSKEDFLHNISHGYSNTYNGLPVVYAKMISCKANKLDLCPDNYVNNKINEWFLHQNYNNNDPIAGELASQFHFNTHKLNVFLQKLCEQRDIKIKDDIITDIILDKNGNIESLIGGKNNTTAYNSDFFIDATGLRRLLISKLGAKWQSYSKYLTLNSAIAFQTEDTDEYNMYTISQAMKYGWMWRIPTYGRWGNGYVFDDKYIDFDEAQKEVEILLNKKINIGKKIKFDPGALDKVWIKNCVAVGLSANFVEPLEATSISTSIQQAFLLVNSISNYDENVAEDYNNKVNDIMINIRDFIILHYFTDRNDSNFWKDLKNRDVPKTLKEKMSLWKCKMPDETDFKESMILFNHLNYMVVMYGLNLLNLEMIKNNVNKFNDSLQDEIESIIMKRKKHFGSMITIGHKDFLTKIREM